MLSKSTPVSADPVCVCAQIGCGGAEFCGLGGCATQSPRFRSMKRGDRVPARGSGRMRFHVVHSGLVATCALLPDGRRQILCLNFPGDVVCSMSAEGAECWCEALTHSVICNLDLSANAERLQCDPAFFRVLFRLVHERLEGAAAHLVALGRFDAMERACGFLAYMTRRTGRQQETCWHTCLPMTREDIADYLGLNIDTVGRLLTRIKEAGLARFLSPTEYEVPCLERLEMRVPISLGRGFDGPPHSSTGTRIAAT
ncbi:MAG TPA: helix-turn-helix domain-containing protein [Hyphomicrobiaceae bacterium]|nr:helix-turn-helix domain-containing protein [Hyphomicrobiaceae bacterium]